jgi:hypothetical protein
MPKPSKRDQLVEPTKELLWEVGYEAMSPRDIQARSAAKPGSLRSRKFGHKLQALWDACVAEGLQSHPVKDAFIVQAVELLDPFATDFEFRYVKVGRQHLPRLEAVESAVADLMAAVRPHCEATVSAARGEPRAEREAGYCAAGRAVG